MFPRVIPLVQPGCLCLTHPFATHHRSDAFDLHVLGTPPAFILSQDQTLHDSLFTIKVVFLWLFFVFWLLFLFFSIFSFFRSKLFDVFCSVFNGLRGPWLDCLFILPRPLSFDKSFFAFFYFFCIFVNFRGNPTILLSTFIYLYKNIWKISDVL